MLGTYLATLLGLTGIVWWSFVILFWIVLMSLITFLPLTYIVLHSTRNDKYLAFTFIMQTIAANMGGMITPYGNPQNLYLYSYYDIPTLEFVQILLPHFLIIILLLVQL